MYQPFAFMASAGGGGLPDIYQGTNLEQWLAPEVAASTSDFETDQSGNGRDATIGGSEWLWNASNYLEITSGTSTSNVVTTGYKPDMSNAFTYQVWVWVVSTSGTSGDADCGILHNLTGGNSANSFSWRARRTTTFTTFMRAGGSAIFSYNDTGGWGQWRMLTFTSSGTGDYTLYWDDAQKHQNLGASSMSSGQDTTMYLGGIFDGNTSNYFTAVKYGAYRVYTEELSSTNVQTNFDAEKAHYGL